MRVLYLAAPVSASTPAEVRANIARAHRWHRWLQLESDYFDAAIVAPWLHWLNILDENWPKDRARGIAMSVEVARRCDGVILVGGRITSGMRRELFACLENGGEEISLLVLGEEAPSC